MKPKIRMLMIILAGVLAATPALAQRSHGPYGGHGGSHGHAQVWGPLGFLLGTAVLYSALQPRTVYYEPVYVPPPYIPPTTIYLEQAPLPPNVSAPPPLAASGPVQEIRTGQWWYFCKKPADYYPYIRECPTGWEKVSPTPPGEIRP